MGKKKHVILSEIATASLSPSQAGKVPVYNPTTNDFDLGAGGGGGNLYYQSECPAGYTPDEIPLGSFWYNSITGTLYVRIHHEPSDQYLWVTPSLECCGGAVNWISSNGTNLLNHLVNTSNPHNTTASQLGLGNVDNTSDANKPISTATQTALDLKSNKSEVATVLFKSITQTIVTGKTSETSIYSIPLPMDGFDYMLKVYSQAQISTFAGLAISHRLRVGSYASPIDGASGANSIGQQTLIAVNALSSAIQFPITRNGFIFKGGASGSIYGISTASNIVDDANSTGLFSTLTTKDFTTQHYLYVSFNPSNVGAVVQHNQILITLIKI